MKNVVKLFFAGGLWLLNPPLGVAHEGHGIPGALPPAPHGGVVQEVKHAGEHEEHGHEHGDHKHEEKGPSHKHDEPEEQELFLEAVYLHKEILVYPLVLPTGANPMFVAASPEKEFAKVTGTIEIPWLKKTDKINPIIEKEFVRIPFDSKNANRFIIHLALMQGGEQKQASIQIVKE